MKNLYRFIFIHLVSSFVGSVLFASCCSLSHGPNQDVEIVTDPVGASIYDGNNITETPTTLNLKREKDHTFVISKEGYEIEKVSVNRKVNSKVAGNIIMPLGIVCAGIDAASGAMWDLHPSVVFVTLRPIEKPWYQKLSNKMRKMFSDNDTENEPEDVHERMKKITFHFLREAKKLLAI